MLANAAVGSIATQCCTAERKAAVGANCSEFRDADVQIADEAIFHTPMTKNNMVVRNHAVTQTPIPAINSNRLGLNVVVGFARNERMATAPSKQSPIALPQPRTAFKTIVPLLSDMGNPYP